MAKHKAKFDNPLSLVTLVKNNQLNDESNYIAFFLPGGHGSMVGLPEDENVGTLIRWIKDSERHLVAVCHGPAAMVATQVAYIYLVIDNYSRFILSWQVAPKICARIRLQTFKDSLDLAKQDLNSIVKLFVDGGTENNNNLINSYISEEGIPLQKYITMKDILKSNAMVERVNNVLKYECLFSTPTKNLDQLIKKMSEALESYNFIRPQGVLNGLVPGEAFTGKQVNLLRRKVIMRNVSQKRIDTNKKSCCNKCSYICNNP